MTRHPVAVACRMKSSLSGADVTTYQPSIMAKTCTAALLAGALVSASMLGAAAAASLDGAQVSGLINERLAGVGLAGDPSIKPDRIFPACAGLPEIKPMFGSWNTVMVSCDGDAKWQFAIRTNLTSKPVPVPIREFQPQNASVKMEQTGPIERAVTRAPTGDHIQDEIEVVALSKSLSRGAMITADDLIMMVIPARNALGAFFDPADLVGRRAKGALSANRPVMARQLQPDFLVEEGDEVIIASLAGGISVDMLGFALADGQIGDWIGIENASSGKTVRAKVIGEKKVQVVAKK